jgi:hypothetical protein
MNERKSKPDIVIVSLELEVHELAQIVAAILHHKVLRQLARAWDVLRRELFLEVSDMRQLIKKKNENQKSDTFGIALT